MTVILRLRGLDVKAGPTDIRTFFGCLSIPNGGVYIVGGSLREAFIAFTSERDGKLAMRSSGKFLKGSEVTLRISSMAELEHKLMHKLKKKPPMVQPRPPPDEKPPPSNIQTLDVNTAFFLGILRGLQTCQQQENNEPAPNVDSPLADGPVAVSDKISTNQEAVRSEPGYVRLFGLPASVTKDDLCHFFKGLEVQEAMVNVNLGRGSACLVKFAHSEDASEAHRFNLQPLGSFCVEVRGACEKMWTSALKERENACDPHDTRCTQSPSKETTDHKQKVTTRLRTKRGSDDCLSSKFRKKPRSDSASTTTLPEYNVMVSNLPTCFTKTEIKQLFGCPNITHSKVLHLLDKESQRTDRAFLIFDKTEDYEYAMNLTGCHVGSNTIEVSSVTKDDMDALLAKNHPRPKRKINGMKKSNAVKKPHGEVPSFAAHTCLFVRNMPADVQKRQIKQIFSRYVVKEDNIFLLHDGNGNGIGEAMVQFKSQKLAALAHRLHGQTYLGSKLLLTPINTTQMEDVLRRNA